MFMVFFVFLANTTKNCDDLLDKATLYYIHDSLIICSFFSNSCYETVFLVENWAWVAALEFVTCTCIKAFSLFLNNPSLSDNMPRKTCIWCSSSQKKYIPKKVHSYRTVAPLMRLCKRFFDEFASKRFATLLKCYYVGLKRYLNKTPAQVLSYEF